MDQDALGQIEFDIDSPNDVLKLEIIKRWEEDLDEKKFHQFSQWINEEEDEDDPKERHVSLMVEHDNGYDWWCLGYLFSNHPLVEPRFDLPVWKAKYKEDYEGLKRKI